MAATGAEQTAGNPSTFRLLAEMVSVRVLTSALPSTYPTPTANAVPTAKISPVTHPDDELSESPPRPPRRLFGADMANCDSKKSAMERGKKPLRVPVALLLL
jgi:hypothetical protein